ncbi:S-adenosyl-L-methionine-dependent methyltransferase [Aspergillus cavernicola]|uniref:S-adenosyl-L-methionine-dependent methyltransferase n=1 Tax=Aspergillus cavernicola TaxID=176166 RepID=A0ABR4I7V1_9EURO
MSAPCYKQTRRDKSSYLLRSVETDEHERLDTQHRMNLHMMHQNILHPSIPKNFERVADIATGNGTWLFDLIKARKEDPESSNTKTRYHGFDISPALFPKENHPALSSADLDFSRHDFYKPFPEEHIGQYDLVHARHLSLAVPIPDLDLAVKNITSLLKPGGHIQWEEYDYRDQLANCPPSKMTDTWHVILAWVADHGYSMTFSSAVHDAVKAAGLDMIEQRQFTTGGLPFCEDHRMTLLYAFDTGIPRRCLKAQGGSDEEVEGIVGECLEEWESGVLLDYYLSRVVARKGD